MLKDDRVMNIVLSALVGEHAINNYVAKDCEWLDGKRGDVLFIPVPPISVSFPPVVVEIQNVVDMPFMHRLDKYCQHVFDKYHFAPIAFTICINTTRVEISKRFSDCSSMRFLKKLPCDFWAKECLVMTPSTLKDYLDECNRTNDNHNAQDDASVASDDTNDNHNANDDTSVASDDASDDSSVASDGTNNAASGANDNSNNANGSTDLDLCNSSNVCKDIQTLPPLFALGYVLMEQKSSLLGLQWKEDPTVMLLYTIAKEVLKNEIQEHETTIDALIETNTETNRQFKRILQVLEEDGDQKRIKKLATAGDLYTTACLYKYQQQEPDDLTAMPVPPNISSTIQAKRGDMKYAAVFKENHLTTHKRMDWQRCYEEGLAHGFFKEYKNYKALKNTFNEANGPSND
ncbi:hypothetical protein DM01DRAFT_1333120 [Hesseltinella vesiculosa]|uniref:Uncharacterized protein n=1 Tax=Hesseltinella vesiculosa TaxID=101127 RepID=A0A1X2GRF2_9FUNG|nr:hypothetical protein DM01DRAFT_1333120 [Hesseltinella vesiculosa]